MTPSMSSGRDLRFSAGPPDRKGNHRRFARQLASTSKRRPSRGNASRHAEDSRETSRAVVAAGAGTTGAIARPHPARRCRSSPADVFDARNVRRGFVLSVRTTCASQRGASTPRLWPACGAPRPRRARTGCFREVPDTSWPVASGGLAAARAMPAMSVRRPHVARPLAGRVRAGRGRPSTGQPPLGP